ncbi:hypothetical protein BDY21DRAFT_336888 [Lineolata rhizophorae]|uniref:SMP domain-containing protein n=1 Tax=Lineolata rhizophorae TaxID=578093 RepID=A0A6A6P7Y2_9PEZI|nr:hypothetical protein BDY21DRAFT_336888 [Lineolata rhizophorae]
MFEVKFYPISNHLNKVIVVKKDDPNMAAVMKEKALNISSEGKAKPISQTKAQNVLAKKENQFSNDIGTEAQLAAATKAMETMGINDTDYSVGPMEMTTPNGIEQRLSPRTVMAHHRIMSGAQGTSSTTQPAQKFAGLRDDRALAADPAAFIQGGAAFAARSYKGPESSVHDGRHFQMPYNKEFDGDGEKSYW